MIIHCVVKENIFVAIVYTLSLQKRYYNVILKIDLKSMANKTIKMPKKGESVKCNNFERKINSPLMI